MSRIILIVIIFSINAAGCATLPPKDYTDFNAADIRSILVVPVVNNSVDVTAPDYFLSTVSIPVAEHGYYVFPVNLIKRTLEDDGLSDANLVHAASTTKLCELFGADAALYIIIERW
ncbi:MAG: GNA1162 family protein, partial [Myxococcota bacterium]